MNMINTSLIKHILTYFRGNFTDVSQTSNSIRVIILPGSYSRLEMINSENRIETSPGCSNRKTSSATKQINHIKAMV